MGLAITSRQLNLAIESQSRLVDLVERAREEDRKALRGKTDGFVIGWCKVKYANELRGSHER